MSDDEEIVYDFTTELQKNKRVSDATFSAAEQRFGKKGVVDMVGISGYYTSLAMQLNTARYQFSGKALVCHVFRTDAGADGRLGSFASVWSWPHYFRFTPEDLSWREREVPFVPGSDTPILLAMTISE